MNSIVLNAWVFNSGPFLALGGPIQADPARGTSALLEGYANPSWGTSIIPLGTVAADRGVSSLALGYADPARGVSGAL